MRNEILERKDGKLYIGGIPFIEDGAQFSKIFNTSLNLSSTNQKLTPSDEPSPLTSKGYPFNKEWSNYDPYRLGRAFFSDGYVKNVHRFELFDHINILNKPSLKDESLYYKKREVPVYVFTTDSQNELKDKYQKADLNYDEICLFLTKQPQQTEISATVKLGDSLLKLSNFRSETELENKTWKITDLELNQLSTTFSAKKLITFLNKNNVLFNEDVENISGLFTKKKTDETLKKVEDDHNKTELDFVKFLYQIRNANKLKTKVTYETYSGQGENESKERVFIAGKIFPILNVLYRKDDAFASLIKLKKTTASLLKENFGSDDKRYNTNYISIGNDAIKIFLPKNEAGMEYDKILLDFLTNGKLTANTIGGEFPDYKTYKLALGRSAKPEKAWKGEDGSWLTKDRENKEKRWFSACDFIIENQVQGRLAPFKQIAEFYDYLGILCRSKKYQHEIKWYKGAYKLVNALWILDGGTFIIANDVEIILNELNLGICDYAITQFYRLLYGEFAKTPLKGDAAYNFDREFIIFEQGTVAPPIYNKTSKETIEKFQNMADKDPQGGWHGGGSQLISWLDDIIPAFDDFNPPAKVTDNQFRIDLPLLMLYLDKHKPTATSFKNHLKKNDTLNDETKKTIKPYEIK
jgi:hypothetical protein